MSEWFRCLTCGAPADLTQQDRVYDGERWGACFHWECPDCGPLDALLWGDPNI